MKTFKRFILLSIVFAMILCSFVFPVSSEQTYDNAIKIFDSSESLSNFSQTRNLDIIYDETEGAAKLTVNNSILDSTPETILSYNSELYNASDYKYLVIIYKAPTTNSSKSRRTSILPCLGTVTSPSSSYSATFSNSKSDNYNVKVFNLRNYSWWKGQINKIGFDVFTSAVLGDTMYIDSIALLKNESDATNFKMQRLIIRNGDLNNMDYEIDDSFFCASYDNDKYTSPYWKGNITYNEAVFPIENEDGSTSYTLMYTPDNVIYVTDSLFTTVYYEGKDFTVEGNKITFIKDSGINIRPYTYLHLSAEDAANASLASYYYHYAAKDGGYDYVDSNIAKQYINVTYTHSDSWNGPIPESKSSNLPITENAIKNKGSLNIVYYGDSICGGARASSYEGIYPYAEWWNHQISTKLEKTYGLTINATYSSVGGSDAVSMSESEKVNSFVIKNAPDLVFIEFGVNDAQNYYVNKDVTIDDLKVAYKNGVISIIDQIRAVYPKCEFVLVSPFFSNTFDFGMDYLEACAKILYEIADIYDATEVADVNELHKYLLTFKNYADFTGDNICHPNDYMSRVYSQVCLETIVPGGVEPTNANIPQKYEKGDVNKDNKINAIDAHLLAKMIVGSHPVDDISVSDLNGDKKVNSADANIMSKKITGQA